MNRDPNEFNNVNLYICLERNIYKRRFKKIVNIKSNYFKKIFKYMYYLNTDIDKFCNEYRKILFKKRCQHENLLSMIKEIDLTLFMSLNELFNKNKYHFLNFEEFCLLLSLNEKYEKILTNYFKKEKKLEHEKMLDFCSKIVKMHNRNKSSDTNKSKRNDSSSSSRDDSVTIIEL